jgi:hypothetical protein
MHTQVKPPHVAHPVLAIAFAIEKLRTVSVNDIYAVYQGQISPNEVKRCLDILVDVGRIRIEHEVATWLGGDWFVNFFPGKDVQP